MDSSRPRSIPWNVFVDTPFVASSRTGASNSFIGIEPYCLCISKIAFTIPGVAIDACPTWNISFSFPKFTVTGKNELA